MPPLPPPQQTPCRPLSGGGDPSFGIFWLLLPLVALAVAGTVTSTVATNAILTPAEKKALDKRRSIFSFY